MVRAIRGPPEVYIIADLSAGLENPEKTVQPLVAPCRYV